MKIASRLTAVLVGSFLSLASHAETGKIVKTAGRKAIVQFPAGTQIKVGDTVTIESFGSFGGVGGEGGSRDHRLELSASIQSLSTSSSNSSTSVTTTTISAGGAYGWNTGTLEYGPYASLTRSSVSSSNTSSMTLGAGGFFDYNLIENKPGVEMVYGAGGRAGFGQSKTDSTSRTVMEFFGGGFIKWFPLGNATAIRGDAGLEYDRTSVNGVTVSDMGFKLTGALAVYF